MKNLIFKLPQIRTHIVDNPPAAPCCGGASANPIETSALLRNCRLYRLFLTLAISACTADSAPQGIVGGDRFTEFSSPKKEHPPAKVGVLAEFIPGSRSLYGGGDGSTFEKAVAIHAPNAKVGMRAENAWLDASFPGCRLLRLIPMKSGTRVLHQVEVVDLQGNTRKVFFDFTECYGKAPRSQAFLPAPKEFICRGLRLEFSGGDGSSVASAVVITGAPDNMTGIQSQYYWLAVRVPDYRLTKQVLLSSDGRLYDRLDVVASDGDNYSFYFEITGFFGK
jgi:hypothetical protein